MALISCNAALWEGRDVMKGAKGGARKCLENDRDDRKGGNEAKQGGIIQRRGEERKGRRV